MTLVVLIEISNSSAVVGGAIQAFIVAIEESI